MSERSSSKKACQKGIDGSDWFDKQDQDRSLLKLLLDNNGCGAVSVNMQASGQEAHSSLKGAMRAKGAKRGQKGPKEYRGTRIFQKGQKGPKGPRGAKRASRQLGYGTQDKGIWVLASRSCSRAH